MSGKKVLYGVRNMNKNLDSMISCMKLKNKIFEVKLIISEAITNAFIHGNSSDDSKAITVMWELRDNNLCVRVTDCGENKKNFNFKINKKIDEVDLLDENGRGLFIIYKYSDEVSFENNTIIMKKAI